MGFVLIFGGACWEVYCRSVHPAIRPKFLGCARWEVYCGSTHPPTDPPIHPSIRVLAGQSAALPSACEWDWGLFERRVWFLLFDFQNLLEPFIKTTSLKTMIVEAGSLRGETALYTLYLNLTVGLNENFHDHHHLFSVTL